MDLDRNKWYVKWFFWSLGICDEFTGANNSYWCEDRTNLCHFCRVIFFYAPIILLLHAGLVASVIYVLIPMPISYFGGSGYLWGLGAVALLALLVFVLKTVLRWLMSLPMPMPKPKVRPPLPVELKGPGFLELVWEWLVAQKKKICPTIRFIDSSAGEVKQDA